MTSQTEAATQFDTRLVIENHFGLSAVASKKAGRHGTLWTSDQPPYSYELSIVRAYAYIFNAGEITQTDVVMVRELLSGISAMKPEQIQPLPGRTVENVLLTHGNFELMADQATRLLDPDFITRSNAQHSLLHMLRAHIHALHRAGMFRVRNLDNIDRTISDKS